MKRKKKRLLGTMSLNLSSHTQKSRSRKSITHYHRLIRWSSTTGPRSQDLKSQIGCQFKTSSNHLPIPGGFCLRLLWELRSFASKKVQRGGGIAWDKLLVNVGFTFLFRNW